MPGATLSLHNIFVAFSLAASESPAGLSPFVAHGCDVLAAQHPQSLALSRSRNDHRGGSNNGG